jgi:tetratricopeptide (TPR) repeat protein
MLVIGLILSLYLYAQERSALSRAITAEHKEKQLREQAEQSAAWSKEVSRAELLLMHEQYGEAERVMSQVPPHASLVALYNVFGLIHARNARWAQAVTNYERVAKFAPSEPGSFEALAALAIKMGDEEKYRHWRDTILQQFETNRDPVVAATLAEDCLALAPPAADFERIGKMVDVVLTNSRSQGEAVCGQLVKGLYEYRQGHFAAAKDWLQKVVASPDALDDWNRSVQAEMLLAMALYQLKETDAAGTRLANGLQMADTRLIKAGKDLHDGWPAWLLAQALRHEATALIPEVTAANNSSTNGLSNPALRVAEPRSDGVR